MLYCVRCLVTGPDEAELALTVHQGDAICGGHLAERLAQMLGLDGSDLDNLSDMPRPR